MITASVKTEYWFHVSNQEEIPIFGTVDKAIDVPFLLTIIKDLPIIVEQQTDYIAGLIKQNPDSIDILRTFVGVSDKRMYLELSYIFGKTKFNPNDSENVLGYSIYDLEKHNINFFKTLTKQKIESEANKLKNKKSQKAIEIITKYLISKGIISILGALKKMDQMEFTKRNSTSRNKKKRTWGRMAISDCIISTWCQVYSK